MLMLSYFCKSKELWSVGCGSAGCGARNEWYFGSPDKGWSIKVRSLGSTLDFPKNIR